jgi:sulfate-transporting ATPase
MTEVFQFALLGLGAGSIYALLGQGLVLIYRGSGILNLAHGAFAMAGAYLYYELHVVGERSTTVSIAGAITAIALLGVLADQLLLRRLRHASALAQLIGTLGLLVVVQSVAAIRYGADPTLIAPLIAQEPVDVLGATVSSDRLWLVLIAAGLTAGLTIFSRYTPLGWAMSAVSENRRAAAALGWSPELISAFTWGLGAALAALAGILIAPITQLAVTNLTLIVIPALAAALVARFMSFPLTLAAGLLLGVAESEVARYVDITGAAASVPFLVIVAALAMRGSSLPERGHVADRLPEVGLGRIRPRLALGTLAAAVVLIGFVLSDAWLSATIVFLAVGIVLLSLVVLTGYSGQLSLAQFALAGIGALIAARLVQSADVPFALALLIGVGGAGAGGIAFALPALRTRGVDLAVVTLGLGAAAQALLFNNGEVTGSAVGTPVGTPHLFGLDISADDHPDRYAIFILLLFSVCALAVANLRRGRSGRRLLAVRTNERAAAALGISVFQAKLHAFALAGALAGLGGIVLAFRATTVIYGEFGPLDSLQAVAEGVIGGIGYVAGPLIGALLAPGSLGQELSGSDAETAAEYLPLISGVVLLALLVAAPNGLAHAARRLAFRTHAGHEPPAELVEAIDGPTRVEPRPLRVSELSVRYGGALAVDRLGFDLAPGQVLGLIGPNGAGKTSVVDAISGFVQAVGRITLGAQEISGWSPSRRARVGLARSFQSLELFEDMTVLENLQAASDRRDARAMLTDLAHPGHGGLTGTAVAAVKEFGLKPLLERRPSELSFGQRRLLAIARSVATEPSVLLLDEPVAGLDEAERDEFAALVRRLAREWGIAVLVIEHDMEFVMGLCDRIVVIDFGRPIAAGTPSEVGRDPAAIASYLGDDVSTPPAPVPELMA